MNKIIGISSIGILSLIFVFLLSYIFLHQKPIAVTKQSVQDINIDSKFKPVMPSLEKIFSENHTWTATLSAERTRTLLATGDVIPARVVNIQATKLNNYRWPYEKTYDVLKSADITFINLETSLIKDCPLINDGFKFCGSDKNIEGLMFAGVDVASLANNHAGNYGIGAINETAVLLNNSEMLVTGINGSVYKDMEPHG